MKKTALFLFSVIFNLNFIFGQTIINTPSINKYANVVTIDYCTNTLSVPPGMGSQFSIGDKILIIQMKGASLVETNDVFSGQIDDYNNAGNYEVNEILSINSSATDDIIFKYELSRAYNVSGSVQIVNIPQYEDVIIQNTLTCQAWNGSFGGILAFNATGKIIMNADIDVSKKGFRGGKKALIGSQICFGLIGFSGYNCDNSLDCGAIKGEGIGDRYEIEDLARAPNGNGGGGGNDHNGGGGGGSSFGFGGAGGEVSQGGCTGFGALGGVPLNYNKTVNKLFFSGGGGAGDGGNRVGGVQSTAGGNAGGMIFITANSIKSNGNFMISNGEDITSLAIADGAGGGGGGGVVILDINNYIDNLNIENVGGKGGNVEDDFSCPGPGGGGSGGVTWISQGNTPINLTINSDGGNPGILTIPPCQGLSNNATAGADGGLVFNFTKNVSNVNFSKISLIAGTDTIICGNNGAPLWAEYSSSKEITFNWLWNLGIEEEKEFLFKPSTYGKYDIFAKASFNAFDNLCEETYIVHVDIRNPIISIVASSYFGDTVKIGEPIFVNAVVNPLNSDYQYSWSPRERVDPNNDRNATATPYQTNEYCLTVTDEIGCKKTECINLYVYEPKILIPDAFSPNSDEVNNTFLPLLTDDLKVLSFNIYDRWGDLVFSTKENKAWDGTKNGEKLPIDSYIWYLEVEQKLSKKIFKKMGNIMLVK